MCSASFFLSSTDDPVDGDHPLWCQPLPADRCRPASGAATIRDVRLTYGDYFLAVARFCAADEGARLVKAASAKLSRPIVAADIQNVSVFLEKHGAFYHPARLLVTVAGETMALVVNVAASAQGRRTLPGEVRALQRLADQRPFGWCPQVFDSDATSDPPMFLGEWFENFHEFHLTRSSEVTDCAIAVWDGSNPAALLSDQQCKALYRKAALILTACYDPLTAGQIFPWHHAAGDFVVNVQEAGVRVRLVSVRDYAPMAGLAAAPENERAALNALVVFLLHLSLRMRLDRIDGVGEMAWASDACLQPMLDGFFEGLDLAARISGLTEALPEVFQHYCRHCGQAGLQSIARHITKVVFDPRCEERRIIDQHRDGHIRMLWQLIASRSTGVHAGPMARTGS